MTRPIVAALSAAALVALALYAVFFAAFLPPTPYDSTLTQAPVQFAERYLAWIVGRNWAAVSAVTDPQVLNDEGWKGFAAIADTVPKGTPTAIHVIGLNTTTSSGVDRTGVTLEYVLPDKPFLADFVLRHDGTFIVEGVHVQLIAVPLEQYYAFHFLGQRPMNYVAFAGAVALIVFNAYALARCILMTGLRRKWLWIIFILVGFGSIQYSWTDGVWSYAILSVYVPSVRLSQASFQSFLIGASVPIGAIVFVLRRRALAGPGPAEVFD